VTSQYEASNVNCVVNKQVKSYLPARLSEVIYMYICMEQLRSHGTDLSEI